MAGLRNLLVLSRPRFWLYLAGPVLVGIAYGASSLGELFAPITVGLFAYFLVPANVYLYGINDIFDAEIDRKNPKKDGRETRFSGDPAVLLAVAVAGLLGVGLLVVVPPIAAPWLAGFFILGGAYSAPPRLKTKPPLDSISNGLYILPGGAAYAATAGGWPPAVAILGGWLWTMAMHTFSAIPDIGPDRQAGIRTTATLLGKRATLAYCGVCWALATGAFALLDPRAGVLLAVYPALVVAIEVGEVPVSRAYWWYPAINAGVGMALTLGGLWGIAYG